MDCILIYDMQANHPWKHLSKLQKLLPYFSLASAILVLITVASIRTQITNRKSHSENATAVLDFIKHEKKVISFGQMEIKYGNFVKRSTCSESTI